MFAVPPANLSAISPDIAIPPRVLSGHNTFSIPSLKIRGMQKVAIYIVYAILLHPFGAYKILAVPFFSAGAGILWQLLSRISRTGCLVIEILCHEGIVVLLTSSPPAGVCFRLPHLHTFFIPIQPVCSLFQVVFIYVGQNCARCGILKLASLNEEKRRHIIAVIQDRQT